MKKLSIKGFSVVEALLILVILGLIGGVGYYVYQATQSDDVTVNDSTVLPKEEAADEAAEEAECVEPTAANIENIEASITSGNTAALEGYMAGTVNVIFAASEGLGDRTAAEAVGDITSFISDATAPWDFDLPAAELSGYQAGGYKQYFPASAVVGKSANNKLISFTFNCDGKISGVFVTPSSELL